MSVQMNPSPASECLPPKGTPSQYTPFNGTIGLREITPFLIFLRPRCNLRIPHDIRVRYPHIYRFAKEIVDIRFYVPEVTV